MQKTLYSKKAEILRSWLKDSRLEAGLTMRELAARLEVPFQFIHKVESGERRLDVVEYVAYCEALGVEVYAGLSEILNMK